MREFCTYGSVGEAPGNRRFYPEIYSKMKKIILFSFKNHPRDDYILYNRLLWSLLFMNLINLENRQRPKHIIKCRRKDVSVSKRTKGM